MGVFVNYCAGMVLNVMPAHTPEALLINPLQYASRESEIRATLRMFNVTQPKYVMLDSGGYQLFKLASKVGVTVTYDRSKKMIYTNNEVNHTPYHVINIAPILKPSSAISYIVTALDLPVPKISNPNDPYVEFMRKLGFNLVWMRETSILRQHYCPQFELFIPIQAYTLDQFCDYIEKPLLELDFNGLSLPTRNLGPGGITLFLIKFYQIGVRKVHLLSVSNFTGLAVAAYFARNIFDWCSVDATSWRLHADNLVYMDPKDLHGIPVGRDARFREGEKPDCDCPWCRGKTFSDIKNIPDTDERAFLRNHNYYVVEKAGREFYDNSSDLVTLERCLRRRGARYAKRVDELITALSIATFMRGEDIRVLEGMLWQL